MRINTDKILSDCVVNEEFMMDGYSTNGEFIKTKCKLISYQGMKKYIIENDGVLVLADGDDVVYPIIDDMVYENDLGTWVHISEYDIPGFEGTMSDLNNLSIRK